MEFKKKKKGNKRLGSFLFSLVMAIALFITLLMVEKTLMTPNGLRNVYVATSDIESGTIMDESNIKGLFSKKEVDGDLAVTNFVDDLDSLVGKVTTRGIEKGTVVSSNGFEDLEKFRQIEKNPAYITVSVEGMDMTVAGKIRPGDVVSVLYNDKETGQSELVFDEVLVEKAYSSDGVEIQRGDSGSATLLGFYVPKNRVGIINATIAKAESLRIVKIENVKE